jgi:hypothetical protein
MKSRRIIYLLAVALVAYFLYTNNTHTETIDAPQAITHQQIFTDFADLKDNSIPKATLGGTYFTTEVFFPRDFTGDAGDEFYVSMEDGHTMYTQRYIIYKEQIQSDKTAKLVYKLKANWENYRPPAGKYESYKFDGEKWTQVK